MKQRGLGKFAIMASAFACAAVLSFGWSEQSGVSLSIESAQARAGRPLTPVSGAGVARRHTRRALVGVGVAGTAGAIATGPYHAGSGPNAFYGDGWEDYAGRNGIVCGPGTLFRGQDGYLHPCQ
jgi:hypothetical protein